MKQKLQALWLGWTEFKSNSTTHFDYPLIEWYDFARELRHIINFRMYESD